MQPTQRTYTHKTTGEIFRLYKNATTHAQTFISETTGERMRDFLISAFTAIDFRLKDKTVIRLQPGEILPFTQDNPPTHKKFFMQTRFSKY